MATTVNPSEAIRELLKRFTDSLDINDSLKNELMGVAFPKKKMNPVEKAIAQAVKELTC